MARPRATDIGEYRRKRDFSRTPEPKPKVAARKGKSFVVQKHAARRLHYDFRLELDGVLKSWAVAKGPSLDPAEKRLAVRTEDHPLEYGDFEGTIPAGEYGAGTVMVWDRGTWEPDGDPHEGLREGKLSFRLNGERMRGGWALIRMKSRQGERAESWLLVKERDEEADTADALTDRFEDSVKTGRDMGAIARDEGSEVWSNTEEAQSDPPKAAKPKSGGRKAGTRSKVKAGRLPAFQPLQLATLVDAPPGGRGWLHELKYDGYRCLLAVGGGEARCYTRKGLDWTARFQRIARAAEAIETPSALIDGEIVAFTPDGRTDFSTLHEALKTGGPIAFFAFDLLELEGQNLKKLALLERKEKLAELLAGLPKDGPIRYSEHVRGEGEKVFGEICAAGHEGTVAKKVDAPYRSRRTRAWRKVKCTRRQELVIAGWTPSTRRAGFASLLLGAWRDGELVYAGRVGTGFDQSDLRELGERLKKLERKTPPFREVPREVARRARWAKPELVAEIAFTEVTPDGARRHPSFLGLREDKPAREVRLEIAERGEQASAAAGEPAGARPRRATGGEGRLEIEGVRVSHPERVLYPGQGVTKAELAAYYQAVAGLMLEHGARRPLALVRCPQGRARQCFFQKHDTGGFPAAMKKVAITESGGEAEDYFYFDDLAGIVAGVQMGVLEFHIWGARIDAIEKPDRLVFDLDPDEGLAFAEVRRAALDLRDRLDRLGLVTFAMLTGGKGVHVVAPLARRMEWPQVKAFARGFARTVAGEEPERFTATASKARRKGRIFLDYLRNDRGSTAIAPYSTRRREGAPVAAPVTWKELETADGAAPFDVRTMPERVRSGRDPWQGYAAVRQSITRRMMAAVGA